MLFDDVKDSEFFHASKEKSWKFILKKKLKIPFFCTVNFLLLDH